MTQTSPDYLFQAWQMRIPYQYAAGAAVGRFLEELRDNGRIYGNKCPQCGRVLVPPRIACGRCHIRMDEWIDLGTKGTVISYTVCEQAFLDPSFGELREVPYTFGAILMDGADGVMQHLLKETNASKLRIGMRVQAVFKPREQRKGNIRDIIHFETIEK